MASAHQGLRLSHLATVVAAFLAGGACGDPPPDPALPASSSAPGVESDGDAAASDEDAALTQTGSGVWVSATGSDETGTGATSRPFRTLEGALKWFVAQKQKGLVSGTFTITLLPGTYPLSKTISITSAHSGLSAAAPLVIRAKTPGTVTLSGGLTVDSFSLAEDGLWRAPLAGLVPSGELRHLWVNGRRARRAASADAMGLVDQSCRSTSATTRACNATAVPYYLGPYKASSDVAARIARWTELRRVEVVNNDSYKQSRCLIDRVEGQLVYMQEPCWSDAHATQNNGSYDTIHPVRVENAKELLDEPGEWYFEAGTRTLFYRPLPGETIAGSVAVVPRIERLLTIAGTSATPVRDITLSGLSFAHATWLRPSTGAGFAEYQANMLVSRTGDHFPNAAVALTGTQRVAFLGGSFVHLGGVGLDLGVGANATRVANAIFTDISSAAMFLGSRLDSASVNDGNVVEQNLLFDVGAEYQGAPAIVAGFTQRLVLQRNEIHDVPYTGISLGWGWSTSSATGNLVKANEIVRHMQVMDDGGGIYTLGDQPGTQIVENVVRDPRHGYGGIYLDDCTSRVLVQSNVVWVEQPPAGVFTLGGVMAKGFSNTVLGNYLNDIEGGGTGVGTYTQAASSCGAKIALNGADNYIGSNNVTLTSLAGAPSSLVDGAGRTGAPLWSASISVSPATLTPGQAAVITWTSVNASVCGSLGGFSTGGAVSGRATTGALMSTKSYQISCTGPGGTFLSNVATVTVQPR